MTEYIGIDLGGTNIRVGAIDEKENIIYEYKEKTYKDVETKEDLYNKIKALIKKVPDYKQAKAIGIGVPGSINKETKKIATGKNIQLLIEYPLAEKLQKEFGKSVYIENDARVANLAEAIKGKGKDKRSVCYITISTGLGGGIVKDKNIYRGSSNLGAYFSRMILDGIHTSDKLISGTGLLNQAKNDIDKNIKKTSEVFELAKQGNHHAKELLEQFKTYLTALLLNISITFNPDIIILGGGVMKSKDLFLKDVKNRFKEKAHVLAKDTIIETATFEEPGLLGAALLAKEGFRGQFS